jgi:hypothetical protein
MNFLIGFAIVFLGCFAALCLEAWASGRFRKEDNGKRASHSLVLAIALIAIRFLVNAFLRPSN